MTKSKFIVRFKKRNIFGKYKFDIQNDNITLV